MPSKLEDFRNNQLPITLRMHKLAGKNLFFRLFLIRILPMGFLTGIKVIKIDEKICMIAVRYKWLNKNPFRSTYFAVLSMAAELSTGLPAFSFTYRSKPAISMLVTGMKAEFVRKATGVTVFTFEEMDKMKAAIELAVDTGEGVICECLSIGRDNSGKEVARFYLTWSFRVKVL